MSITTADGEEQTSRTQYEADTYKIRTDIRRRSNFTRSPSLEKIIKFNTYICSQNFFILPSLLAWLKSSHTVLKSYAGRCTAIVKAIVYSSMIYKIIQAQTGIMVAALKNVSIFEPRQLLRTLQVILMGTERSLSRLPEKINRKLSKSAVYFCLSFIFVQLVLCLWTFTWHLVPSGLIFLLVCLTIVSYANYYCLKDVSIFEPKQLLHALKVILMKIERSLEQLPEQIKRKLLKSAVYFCFFYIFLQLALCLWTLTWRLVPSGLIFLLVCLTIISYANYNCLRFIIIEELLKEEERNATPVGAHISRGYIRRRDILGQRTISNVKLF